MVWTGSDLGTVDPGSVLGQMRLPAASVPFTFQIEGCYT